MLNNQTSYIDQNIEVSPNQYSEVEGVLNVVSDLLLLAQTFLKMLDFFTQKIVHFQFFLHHVLKLFHISVDIEIDVANSLDLGNEFTLLSEQFGILFDSCHVCGEDFFLFLQNVCDFLLECKVLFAYICIFKSGFHYVYVFLYFFFVDMVHFVAHFLLDNFLDLLVILFLWVHPIAFHSSFFLHAFIDQW